MIHIDGDIKQVSEVEELIKKGVLYLTVSFTVRKLWGKPDATTQNLPPEKLFSTNKYEIFGSPSDVRRVKNNGDRIMRDIILWLTQRNMVITFAYDYRHQKGEITVSCDSWVRLCKLLPKLKGRIVVIEANKCEFVKQVASI